MNKYIKILPEIIVGLGDHTVFDNPESPTKEIIKFHINIENWLGDDLLWNFPETIVTERLKIDLENNFFSGFSFDDILITKDEYFDYNFSNANHGKILPKFYWMKIIGVENKDDFFLKKGELYISEDAFHYVKNNYSVNNLIIEPQKNEFDDFILSLVEKDKQKLKNIE